MPDGLDMPSNALSVNNIDQAKSTYQPVSDRHAAALSFAAAGYPVFPCIVNGKAPACDNGLKDRTTDPLQINAWWRQCPDYNIGIVPEDCGECVIDIDPGNGGREAWAALCIEHGQPPVTREVVTPSGGRHLWFKGSLPPSASKLGPGIDVRGRGSYCLAPPSYVIETKKGYEGGYQRLGFPDPAELPAWISEALRWRESAPIPVPANVALDDPETLAWARERIAGAIREGGEPVNGEASDPRTFALVCELRDGDRYGYSLEPETVVDLLTEHWAPHFDREWIETKVSSAYRGNAQNPPGVGPADCNERFFDLAAIIQWRAEHPEPANQNIPSRQKWIFTKPSIAAKKPPLTYWDDHRGARERGMLPKVIGGCSVIVWGRMSSHKSGVILKECLDAALTKGARVMYLAPEGASGIDTARLPAACKQRGIRIETIDDLWRTFPASPGLMNHGEIDELIERCREEGFLPDIVVVDTLTRAVAGFDINAPATGAGLIVGMERFGAAFDATVIAVTHPGKDSDKGAIGSSLIGSLAFAIWHVSLDGECVFVEVQKMKDGPADFTEPFKVAWRGKEGEPVPAREGTPVVVAVAPSEELQRDSRPDGAMQVSERTVRTILAGNNRYGAASMKEEELAVRLAGSEPRPDEETALLEWQTRLKKISGSMRSARNQKAWAKGLCDRRLLAIGGKLEWVWFLPEAERPVGEAGAAVEGRVAVPW